MTNSPESLGYETVNIDGEALPLHLIGLYLGELSAHQICEVADLFDSEEDYHQVICGAREGTPYTDIRFVEAHQRWYGMDGSEFNRTPTPPSGIAEYFSLVGSISRLKQEV